MYLDYISLFWVLIGVLVAGILMGRIWSYFSAREEGLISRRLVRGSSSYVLGMNYLISNQPELAIMELSRAAEQDPEAVEVHVVLGNLYREKGQVERAIQIHNAILGRKGLSPSERNLALFCLGLDYKSAGFVDRAIEIFEQIVDADSSDEGALANLVKLYEEVSQLDKAYRLQQELGRLRRSEDHSTLSFLEVQMGKKLLDRDELEGAERRFQRAIDLEPRTYPAYLFFGDLFIKRGDRPKAVEMWERMVRINYKRAHLAFERLAQAYQDLERSEAMESLLLEVMENNRYDWRSRIFLAQIHAQRGDSAKSYELFKQAVELNPHSLAIHQKVWKLLSEHRLAETMLSDYIKMTEDIVFFLDPFVCIECGYKTTEFLWKCPHCHSWDSFAEARM
jgi:lipopolysaccharide biosynthesis regulator YciM